MRLNVNDRIRFRPTPEGREVMAKKGIVVPPGKGGYYSMQLWVWAQTFGDNMYNGGPNLFVKNEIIIGDN